MAERKTFNVERFRDMVNAQIKRCDSLEGRKELCDLLTEVLMQADRYRGFMYLDGWKGVEEYHHRYY